MYRIKQTKKGNDIRKIVQIVTEKVQIIDKKEAIIIIGRFKGGSESALSDKVCSNGRQCIQQTAEHRKEI